MPKLIFVKKIYIRENFLRRHKTMGQKKDMTGWVMAEHGVPDSRLTVIKEVEPYISANGARSF